MLEEAIDVFFDHYVKTHPALTIEHDPEWASPCEVGIPWRDGEHLLTAWKPTRRASQADVGAGDFAGLEHALGFEIHPDIKTHYGRYWSGHLEAEAPDGHASFLFLWNDADAERLIENLIGHAVACRHNKVPFSVFFACTEAESEYYLTVNNETGQVQVEQPGHAPIRIVCDSLAEFYNLCVPARSSLSS